MNLSKQSYEILTPDYSWAKMDADVLQYQNKYKEIAFKQIELAARNCYGSQSRITEDSCWNFVNSLMAGKHHSPLEFGTIYLTFKAPKDANPIFAFTIVEDKYNEATYSRCVISDNTAYVTSTLRVLVENGWLSDLQYICAPTEKHIKRYAVKLNCCIHTYKDLTRHRKASFCIESTRFINYMKEKFNATVNFILPSWLKDEDTDEFEVDCKTLESIYAKWIEKGYKAQQAAYFLCQGTAAVAYMCLYEDDWKLIFRLRTSIIHETGMPLPQVFELIDPIYKEFVERGYIEKLD